MFIYNITIKVENSIHQRWLSWMSEQHIPFIMSSGKFTDHQLLRLREVDESDGPTYALQLFAESKADYNAFKAVYEADCLKKQRAAWDAKMLCFSTLMERVH